MSESPDVAQLLERAGQGDQAALTELFSRYRDRLKRMVRLRMNRRLVGRVDDSDILQDAYLEITRCLKGYLSDPSMPFYLWLRHITGQKLITAHRRHLGAQQRDAGREVSLHRGPLPPATSASLAARLLGRLTSPSQAAIRAEVRIRLQDALNSMNAIDREVLVLRHFEQLSNAEAARLLDIQEPAASKRYIRALSRLQQILAEAQGAEDG